MPSYDIDRNDLLLLRQALEEDDATLVAALKDYHASEIADLCGKVTPDDRERIVNVLPSDVASEVLAEMDDEHHPEEILFNLHPEKRSEIVEELDYDDATDLISQMDEEDQQEVLQHLDEEDASNIRNLLSYDEDTAGGLMNTEIIKVNINLTKIEALDEIIRQSEEMDDFYIYVVDDADVLQGFLAVKEVLKSRMDVHVTDMVNRDFIYVKAEMDQEEVARLFSQYNLTSIPVVDDRLKLLGRITVDDIIDVLEEESTEDILKIAGVSEDEELGGTWQDAIKSRLPWLIINLGTAFLAASVIRSFDATVSKLVILSSYMTIIAGMGGNAATQALAVTVRRISLINLSDRQAYVTVFKEFLVGTINGASNGIIVFLIAVFFDHNPKLGLVLFLSMTGNLLIAGLAGSSIPLLLKRVGIDPAVASSIIITTFTDCFGFLLILGLASKLLL